jgi:hypothetical protein
MPTAESTPGVREVITTCAELLRPCRFAEARSSKAMHNASIRNGRCSAASSGESLDPPGTAAFPQPGRTPSITGGTQSAAGDETDWSASATTANGCKDICRSMRRPLLSSMFVHAGRSLSPARSRSAGWLEFAGAPPRWRWPKRLLRSAVCVRRCPRQAGHRGAEVHARGSASIRGDLNRVCERLLKLSSQMNQATFR